MEALPDIMQADSFLRGSGMIGDVQRNNLILTSLCACPQLKNIAFDIDTNNRKIEVTLYLGRWRYLFTSRNRMVDQLTAMYQEYLPNFSFLFKFDIYGRRKINTTVNSN